MSYYDTQKFNLHHGSLSSSKEKQIVCMEDPSPLALALFDGICLRQWAARSLDLERRMYVCICQSTRMTRVVLWQEKKKKKKKKKN
jgi:hypothetical protein